MEEGYELGLHGEGERSRVRSWHPEVYMGQRVCPF